MHSILESSPVSRKAFNRFSIRNRYGTYHCFVVYAYKDRVGGPIFLGKRKHYKPPMKPIKDSLYRIIITPKPKGTENEN